MTQKDIEQLREISQIAIAINHDPDIRFRLLPCKCKSDSVAYEHYNGSGGTARRVRCYDCGFTMDKDNKVRHDAQLNLSEEVKV